MSNQRRQFDSDEHAFMDFGEQIADGVDRAPRNELEATFVCVQRALRGPDDLPTMPLDLKSQIWEDIMTSAPTPDAHAIPNPWPAPHRGGTAAKPRSTPLFRRMAWSHAANIALAALVILAGFGIWRVFDGDFGTGGGGNDDPATIPGVAMQPSTRETITAPAATPAPITACDLSGDIPIIPDVADPNSPVETTSLIISRYDTTGIDPRGDLKLTCAGEPNWVLSSNVISASPGPWPGTVSLAVLPPGEDDLANLRSGYVSVASGDMVMFGKPTDDSEARSVMTYSVDGSPWVVGPLANDPSELAVLDLRTMESRPLSAMAGIPAPADVAVMLSTPADDGTVALGFAQTVYGGRLKTNTGAPGDLLLLGDSFDDTHWITLSEDLPLVTAMALSPDGSHAALTIGNQGDSITYGIVDTADGAAVAQSPSIPDAWQPFMAWVQEGSAISYAAGNDVQVLKAELNAEPGTVLDTDQTIAGLRTTPDPDVVVATIRADHGSDAHPASTDVDKVFSVNVATGETHEFEGMELGNSISWITSTNALFMYDYIGMDGGTVTIRVHDPVSGDLVNELEDVPNPNNAGSMAIGKNSITASGDGTTMAYTIGSQHISVVQTRNGPPVIERITPPNAARSAATVVLSRDGSFLSLSSQGDESRTRWLLDLSAPDGDWTEVPNTVPGQDPGYILFAEGTGD